MPHTTGRSLLRRVSMAAVVAVSVAACQSPPAGPPDYGDKYSVTPVLTNYILATKFEPGTGTLAHEDEGRLQRFVKQFHRRGRSYLVIATTRDGAGDDAYRHMAEFQRRLMSEGIDAQRIDIRPGAAPLGNEHSVVMSFRGYEAKTQECGDWTGAAGFNPGNLPHTNYGCAYQRNFGLMLSDPGELMQSQDEASPDSTFTGSTVRGYREGERKEAELESISSF